MFINVEFEKGIFGLKATLTGPWSDSYLKLLLEKGIKELELNDGKGWRGENLDFLQYLPDLKSLIVIDLTIKSVEGIYYLNELTELTLITYCNKAIDFSIFPKLQKCAFEWIKGSESLFNNTALVGLSLNRYDKSDSEVFSNWSCLESLTILNSKIEDLKGLSALSNLKYLSIANLKNLKSLKGIENLQNLETLEIQRCKSINSVSEIFNLYKVSKLLLVDLGNIESLNGLENLQNLTMFMFYESTNIIDGDLLPITKLIKLERISFQNRKHYSHKREGFSAYHT